MSSSKITSKALGSIVSITSDVLFMHEWGQPFPILYVFLDKEPLLMKTQDEMNKDWKHSKALRMKWVFSSKEYLFLNEVLSLTLHIKCLESFKRQRWSIERNYSSLMRPILPILYLIVLRKFNTCKLNLNNE